MKDEGKTETELERAKQSKEQAFPKWTTEQMKMRKAKQLVSSKSILKLKK